MQLLLTPEEMEQGVVKKISLKSGEEIIVKIPTSLRDGQKIRIKGKGKRNADESQRGNLYLQVVKASEDKINQFRRFMGFWNSASQKDDFNDIFSTSEETLSSSSHSSSQNCQRCEGTGEINRTTRTPFGSFNQPFQGAFLSFLDFDSLSNRAVET